MAGNTKGGRITVPLTSCLTGLESAVGQLTIFVFICKSDQSKPVKQEVNGTMILPPLVFPGYGKGMFLFWFLIWYSMWYHYFAVVTGTTISCNLGRRYRLVFSLSFLDVYGFSKSMDNQCRLEPYRILTMCCYARSRGGIFYCKTQSKIGLHYRMCKLTNLS